MKSRRIVNANYLQTVPVDYGLPPDGGVLVYDATVRRYRLGIVRPFGETSTTFSQPSANATAVVSIDATAWIFVGQELFIATGGHYQVTSIPDATHVVLLNPGYPTNAAQGTTIPGGSTVSPAGLPGPQGDPGTPGSAGSAGANAWTSTSNNFTQPAANQSTVSVSVASSAPFAPNEVVFVAGGGYYQVASIPDAGHLSLTNLGYAGNASANATISSGALVVAGGLRGPTGAAGTGTTTATPTSLVSGAREVKNYGSTTASNSYNGARDFDASQFANKTFTLAVWGLVTPGRTLTVDLYNETDAAYVSGASVTITASNAPAKATSGPLTLPSASKMYSVRARLDSNNGLGECGWIESAEITVS